MNTLKKTFDNTRITPIATKVYFFFELILYICLFLFLYYRLAKGVELTDESWYVAEPFLVAKGKIPYINSWSQTPGFTIPLAFAFYIYTAVKGTAGIFLFSRYLYLAWQVLIGAVIVWLVNKKISDKLPVIWYLPFFLIITNLFDIDYNTIGVVYLSLVIVLVLIMNYDYDHSWLIGIICGFIGARAFIGSPYIIVPYIIILVFLTLKGKKSVALSILSGALLCALVTVGWCCLRSSIPEFFASVSSWMQTLSYSNIPRYQTYQESFLYLFNFLKPALIFFAVSLVMVFLFSSVGKLQDNMLETFLAVFSLIWIIIGLRFLFYYNLNSFVQFSWFESIALLFVSRKKDCYRTTSAVTILFFSAYLTSSFGNISGFGSREYWLVVPAVMSYISVTILLSHLFSPTISTVSFTLLIIVLVLFQCKLSFNSIYRDNPIAELNTKVNEGIWKGCYTSEQRACDIQDLEKQIRKATNKNDKVLFLDWASFGYMMTEGSACTCTSLDPVVYSYKLNDPTALFTYFSQEKTVPDKIIYIDYGRDEKLSIEDPSWVFNDYVKSSYTESSRYNNNSYRMLVFELVDFSQAIEYVSSSNLQSK